MRRVFGVILCCSILLCTLTGCQKQEDATITDKLDAELSYIEDLIYKIAIKHAKGEYIEDEKFNWDDVKGDILKINGAWSTLLLDLTQVNIANENLIQYSNDLNSLLITVGEQNDTEMISILSDMDAKIIEFKKAYSENRSQVEKKRIRSEVLSVYSLVLKADYESAKAEATTVLDNYKSLMNDRSYAEENQYNLNKIYVLLEEYVNAIAIENYDVIRMKYILAVEEL